MSDAEPSSSVSFRRPAKKAKTIRKVVAKPESSSGSDDSMPDVSSIKTTNQKRKNKLTQSTKKDAPEKRNSSSTESDSDNEPVPSKKFAIDVKYASAGLEKAGPSDMGATARTEHDTGHDQDAQAQFERIQKALTEKEKEGAAGSSKPGEKLYQGQAMYGASLQKDNARGNAKSGLNRLGPIRATQYMRASVRWDYAPDICKDYKETGFCTFGDSCKFMHDRGDYKHGWELERDWEQGKLNEAKDDEYLISGEEDGDSEDEFPFACYICREDFVSPVVTKCSHYFCEKCALAKCKVRCGVCNEKTGGSFNVAKALVKKLKERAERKETKPNSDDEEADGDEDDDLPRDAVMEDAQKPEDANSDEEGAAVDDDDDEEAAFNDDDEEVELPPDAVMEDAQGPADADNVPDVDEDIDDGEGESGEDGSSAEDE
uniref:C3H1-type domain-containing protein n=1 Tax=Panagrellus redivivus TaxID=6233 RepID=A0A7E4W3D2_PANRE